MAVPRITVGVGNVAVSNQKGHETVTHSLGSCLGVIIYDPVAAVGGLLHLMLPDSNLNLERARKQPAVFADTDLPVLFKSAYGLGVKKGRMRVVVVSRQQLKIGLWVWCPPQVSLELAANILAQECDDLDGEQILDTFREMINMVASGVLTAVDPQGSWTMGLPQAHRYGQGILASTKEQMAFSVDDQPILAGLSVQFS